MCFVLPRRQGISWNQLKSKMTSEETLGISKTAQNVIFKVDGSLDAFFSKLGEKFLVVWTLQELGYLITSPYS